MERLSWYAHRMLRSAGWPNIAAMALSAAVMAFYFLMLAPLQRNLSDFKYEVESLRGKVATRRGAPVAPGASGQLAAFYGFFPRSDVLTETLGGLYDAAAKQNLVLDQGEYHLAPAQEGRLVRYDIVLPVKGPYPRLRSFIAQVLKDNPSLALAGITFNRQAAIDIGVEAQVRLTLYMRTVSS